MRLLILTLILVISCGSEEPEEETTVVVLPPTGVEKGEAGLFQKIMVHPATNITRMEEVLVILREKEDNG